MMKTANGKIAPLGHNGPRPGRGAAARSAPVTRFSSIVMALVAVIVSLALFITPAANLDNHDVWPTGGASGATATATSQADAHAEVAVVDVSGAEVALDSDADLSPDAHLAHHCCHSHVVPVQGTPRSHLASAHTLTYLASHSYGLSLPAAPLLRPPRV